MELVELRARNWEAINARGRLIVSPGLKWQLVLFEFVRFLPVCGFYGLLGSFKNLRWLLILFLERKCESDALLLRTRGRWCW
jgi:hypothetical protein